MSEATESVQQKELFAAHGDVAMLLSNLDHDVGNILDLLIDRRGLVGSFISHDMTFHKRICTVRTLTDVQFPHAPEMVERIGALMKRADAFRLKRNLFIHGLWVVGRVNEGVLTCVEAKWQKKNGKWERFNNVTTWTVATLNSFSSTISELINDLLALTDDLEAGSPITFNEAVLRAEFQK